VGDLLSIAIIMSVTTLVACGITYAWGFKAGHNQGYLKGRAVSRHASSRVSA